MKFSQTLLGLFFAATLLSSCGGGDSGNGGLSSKTSLNDFPDTATMVKTSGSTSALQFAAVSGTPPKLSSITADNAKTYFWNGLIDAILTTGSNNGGPGTGYSTRAEANSYWGAQDGDIGGQGACNMAQSIGYSFEPVLQAGTTFCYMKQVPSASSVTVSPALADHSTIFQQQTGDRVVRVNITGHAPGDTSGGSGFHLFIKVLGTQNAPASSYKIVQWQCGDSGVTSTETDSLNRVTGTFTSVNTHSEDSGASIGTSTITATITTATNGKLAFDVTKDRLADTSYKSDSGVFNSSIKITSDNKIIAKNYMKNTFNGSQVNINKGYSISNFSGDSVLNLQFLDAGFKNFSHTEGTSWPDQTNNSGVEYHTDHYVSVPSSALATQAGAIDFTADSFWSGSSPTEPTADFSGLDCDAKADYTVAMDFGSADIAAIATNCEQNQLSNMNFCQTDSVQQAQAYVQTCNSMGGSCI